jgi:mevalonate kinase
MNTGRSRKTEPLVNLFLEKCKGQEFNDLCNSILLPVTNGCIEDFLEGNIDSLYANFERLSRFQLQHFTPMIPALFRDVWAQGLEGKRYALKLCGAGGGGFLMGMTKDFALAGQSLNGHELRPLFKF